MKIISKFKDYYDNVVQYGFDENLIYVRKGMEEDAPCPILVVETPASVETPRHNELTSFLIRIGNRRILTLQQHCSQIAGYGFHLVRYRNPDSLGHFKVYPSQYYQFHYEVDTLRLERPFSKESCSKFFNQTLDVPPEQSSPVEIYHLQSNYLGNKLYFAKIAENVSLAHLGLAKVLPPFEAHQEISMWLANKTNPEKETVVVENDVRIQQHGFDLITSFRKEKSKKK